MLGATCGHLEAAVASSAARQADLSLDKEAHRQRADRFEEGNQRLREDLETIVHGVQIKCSACGRSCKAANLRDGSEHSTEAGSPICAVHPSPQSPERPPSSSSMPS